MNNIINKPSQYQQINNIMSVKQEQKKKEKKIKKKVYQKL